MSSTQHRDPAAPVMSVAETEEQLELAIDAAEIGLWDFNLLTWRLYWPPRVKAMFGISADTEVTIHDFVQGLHPDDRKHVIDEFNRAQDPAVRSVYDVQYRAIGKEDGRVRWIAAKGRAIFDESGRCTRVVGTAIDVTERMRSEAQLREVAARLAFLDRIGVATRSITDATHVMAVTARLLGEHLGVTRCAYADVDPDNDRFTIRSDWALPGVPSSAGVYSLEMFGPQATTNLRRGQHLVVNNVDLELGDDGGARMFNSIGIKAIVCAGLVKDGRLVAMMAVHQSDPRRWNSGEIETIGEVVDRCWAHIERVRDAAALREQDRHKDEFLATLAHELRNPIAPLRYATAILKMDQGPAKKTYAREVIERQTGHLAKLVDDLLDVSRINRGLIELRREVVQVSELLEQAVEAAGPAIEQAKHHLTLQLPEGDARIDADGARIVQIVTNLLTNAAKYTPDGGDIRLSAWTAGESVSIEVVDNGVGIPLEDQGKLFQLFTQLPHTGRMAQGGLGIGLSLVKRLVELHGGTVRLFSAGLDRGSAFLVELPLAQTQAPAASAAPAIQLEHGQGRILVVEDNPDGLQTLITLLSMVGHEVKGASNGSQALQILQTWIPQIVLLDLGLPGLSGYEVAVKIKQNPALSQIRLVALTGWGAQRDRERTAAAGFDEHLTKPIEANVLLSLLANWLSPRAVDQES